MNGQPRIVHSTNTSQPRYRSATPSGEVTVPFSYPVIHRGAFSSSGEEISTPPRVLVRPSKKIQAAEEGRTKEVTGDPDNVRNAETKRDGSALPPRIRPGISEERPDGATASVPYHDGAVDHAGEDAEMAEVGGYDSQGFVAVEQQRLAATAAAAATLDPCVPVLKAAIRLNKECLWKEQVWG